MGSSSKREDSSLRSPSIKAWRELGHLGFVALGARPISRQAADARMRHGCSAWCIVIIMCAVMCVCVRIARALAACGPQLGGSVVKAAVLAWSQ